MNLQLPKSITYQRRFWVCILLALTSCVQISEKNQQSNKSVSQMSQEVCECFNKHKGDDIDAKLSPCINQIVISSHAYTLKEEYSYQDSINAINTVNALASKDIENASKIMVNLVNSCDAYGAKVEEMYDKWYPIDSSASNLLVIEQLSSKFQNAVASDTSFKEILNKIIAKNIEARRLKEALMRCKQMKKLYKNEGGAYFASAFVYNLQKKYSLAVIELQQEISVSNDKNLNLIIEVIKRKAQRDKATIK